MKKIFVVGAARSGTTYLARAIGLAEDVAYFEESGAFAIYGARQFGKDYRRIFSDYNVFPYGLMSHNLLGKIDFVRGVDRLDNLVDQMLLHTKLKQYDLKPSNPLVNVQNCQLDKIDNELKRDLIAKYKKIIKTAQPLDMLRSFFADFVRLSGKTHFLEKTPAHILMVPAIRAVFPDAKIVLIRREKRDSLASYLKNFNPPSNIYNKFLSDKMLLKKQCQYYLNCEKIEEWIRGKDWCRLIDFVELVETPLPTVCSVIHWAGLSFNENRYRSLLNARKANSHWNKLSATEKHLINKYYDKKIN